MKIFYCDGSTRGKNQRNTNNVGGWGVVCFEGENLFSFDYAINENTTNNREELKALIYCLSSIQELYLDEKCIIYSDSAYVVNTATSWIYSWAKNNWRNSKKQVIENLDLIQELYNLLSSFFIAPDIRKCEGHAGEVGNELADALATNNLKRFVQLCADCNLELSRSDYDWIQAKLGENG